MNYPEVPPNRPEPSNAMGVMFVGFCILLAGYLFLFYTTVTHSVLSHIVILGGWVIALLGLTAYLSKAQGNQAQGVFRTGAVLSGVGLACVVLANFLVMAQLMPDRHQFFQFGVSITISGLSLLLLGSIGQRGGLKRWRRVFAAMEASPARHRTYRAMPAYDASWQPADVPFGTHVMTIALLLVAGMMVVLAVVVRGPEALLRITVVGLGLLFLSLGLLTAIVLRHTFLLRELQRGQAQIGRQMEQQAEDRTVTHS